MKVHLIKIYRKIGKLFGIVIMTFVLPHFVFSQVNADFIIDNDSPCENLIKFTNKSDGATNYLWTISRLGYETIITPTKNPLIAVENIDKPTDFNVKLTAFNIVTGDSKDIEKTITIYPTPEVKFEENWQTMVCSNTNAVEYCADINEGDICEWSAVGNQNFYDLQSSTINKKCLLVNWKNNTEIQPSEIILKCKITSAYGCIKVISNKVLLLPTAVPESATIHIKENTNILLCVFDSPGIGGAQISEDYLYQWGYYPKNNPLNQVFMTITQNAYQQFETISEDNTYFVEIFRKDFSYCKSRIEGISEGTAAFKNCESSQAFEIINVFPNPVDGASNLNLYIFRNDENVKEMNISIVSFLGVKIKSEYFEISQENSHLVISLDNFQNGTYFIEASSQGNQRVVKKFIVLNY